jgi:hypothetical protein
MYAELSVRITAAVGQLLQRAITGGHLRSDITPEDLLQTIYALCYARQPLPGWQEHVVRLLDIFVDGLRTRCGGREI